jgi:amino acid transporter
MACCPKVFSRVHPRFLTPHVSTWVAGFFVAIPAGMFDIGTLADLSNIGTLFAFVLVSLGVLVLRKKQPERRRSFRTPVGPGGSDSCYRVLRHPDGQPADRNLDPIFCVAGHWAWSST